MTWWSNKTKSLKDFAVGGSTKEENSWWMVVLKEPTYGAQLMVSDVAKCKPFTGEHKTKIEHKHDDVSGGSVYILFELAPNNGAAVGAAQKEIKEYQKSPSYISVWQDIKVKWGERDKQIKEQSRRSQYATIGDLEDAIAAHEAKTPATPETPLLVVVEPESLPPIVEPVAPVEPVEPAVTTPEVAPV